jgi:uncharacterized protein (DUF2062 family)
MIPAASPIPSPVAPPVASPVAAEARPSFWRRRLVAPLLALLTQGVTPDKLAATFAVGGVCSMFPFLGTTAALNLGVGLWLRLNQPLLHTLNQLLGPVHVVMILVYVRLGELLWRAPEADRFSIVEMVRAFADLSFGDFLQRFGWAGVHAFTAWALTAPLLLAALYFSLRPVFRRLALRHRAARLGPVSAP